MVRHDHYFDEKQAAAVLKHTVLAHYVRVFGAMTSLQNEQRRAWFIDAYAGAGRYESGDAGSPLIALKAARELQSIAAQPRDLRCVFIEQDKETYAQLAAIVHATAHDPAPVLRLGSADEHLPKAIEAAGSDPVLTFLDPFGTSLPRKLMTDTLLMRGIGISEVLLNFHLGSIARIGPSAANPERLSPGDQKTLERLDLFLGYEEWRELFFETYRAGVERSATEAAQRVAQDYRNRVAYETSYKSFPIPVRKARGHVPIFELTLFYKGESPAEFKFADAASYANAAWRKRASEDEARHNAAKYSDALFSLGDEFSQSHFEETWAAEEKALATEFVIAIKANIRAFAHRLPVPVATATRAVFGEYLGLAGEKHLRRAWRELADVGELAPPPSKLYNAVLSRP